MPSWNELLTEFEQKPSDAERGAWLLARQKEALSNIRRIRGDRNVLFYASAFLQKPGVHAPLIQITPEDLNGFMSTMHGMDWAKGLTLILHTPGGITNAAETIVAYLWSKFESIEIIVPTFAMSAGTMISLAAQKIIMGRQSQLGPIDPLLPFGGRFVSARAVVDQFEQAKSEIIADRRTAHVWAPILQSAGPSLLVEAQNALDYGEKMVAKWLEERMFHGRPEAANLATFAAHHFNDASSHKSHGRRIDRMEAASLSLDIEDLEDDQDLQEHVLTAYHLITIAIEKSPTAKTIVNDTGKMWVKNLPMQMQLGARPVGPIPKGPH